MAIANLQTLDILKKARIAKDATGGPGGGAVTTTDLQAGGLLRPEQGGRAWRLDMQKRKLRKPVLLGKSCSEIAKDKDAGGHGSNKRGESSQGNVQSPSNWFELGRLVSQEYTNQDYEGQTTSLKPNAHFTKKTAVELGISVGDVQRALSVFNASEPQEEQKRFSHVPVPKISHIGKAKDALGHGSEKRGERRVSEKGRSYHFNDDTQRWHDVESGEPVTNKMKHDRLNAKAVGPIPSPISPLWEKDAEKLIEYENRDLTTEQLKRKLAIAEEGHDDDIADTARRDLDKR